jgi:hypothetical protein
MACDFTPVDYVSGNYGGCSQTALAVADWLSNHSGGWLQFGGCFGYSKTTEAGQVSIHATGRAIDVAVNQYRLGSPQNAAAKFLLDTYITPNACALGIQRMTFEGRMWTCGGTTYPALKQDLWPTAPSTMLHTNALHIEIAPDYVTKWRYQDVAALMYQTSSLTFVGGKAGDPANPQVKTLAPRLSDSGADGNPSGGGQTITTRGTAENSRTTTQAVWSATIWELGPCAACGEDFTSVPSNDLLQYTHCGGTGAICIQKSSGQTCSVGTAPQLGNFAGGVRDFIWWGDGGYALSSDGMRVLYAGQAVRPVFEAANTPNEVGPWEAIYAVGPNTIAVSKVTPFGPVSLRATVNNVGTFTCCDLSASVPDEPSPPMTLAFLIDSSGSMPPTLFQSGMEEFIDLYSYLINEAAVYTYEFNPVQVTSTSADMGVVRSSFSTIVYTGGIEMISKAIQYVSEQTVWSSRNVILILTDEPGDDLADKDSAVIAADVFGAVIYAICFVSNLSTFESTFAGIIDICDQTAGKAIAFDRNFTDISNFAETVALLVSGRM